ncbi:MAG: hydrogenase iron-sulfur subunit, partial [Planctomycetes bacterium]|nr:hydrogenase iron-sulfur subunit [Planctomycetota bacterium]
ADGVLVSGCHPQDCHFASGNRRGRRPNLTARRRWIVLRRLVEFVGIDPRRMQFAWVSASEGRKWADLVDEVVARLRQAGPFTEYHRLDRMPVSL